MYDLGHGVLGELNRNAEQLMKLCAIKGLVIVNTRFKKRDIYKYEGEEKRWLAAFIGLHTD